MSAAHRWHRDQRCETYPVGRFARSAQEGTQLALPLGTTVGARRFHACPRARAHPVPLAGGGAGRAPSTEGSGSTACEIAWARTLADAVTHRMNAPNWAGLSLSGCRHEPSSAYTPPFRARAVSAPLTCPSRSHLRQSTGLHERLSRTKTIHSDKDLEKDSHFRHGFPDADQSS